MARVPLCDSCDEPIEDQKEEIEIGGEIFHRFCVELSERLIAEDEKEEEQER